MASHRSSPAALHAARVVMRHYRIKAKPVDQLASGAIHGLRAEEGHLSILIDMASNAYQVAAVRPELGYWQEKLTARTASPPQIGAFIRRLIEALEKVPQPEPLTADQSQAVQTFMSQLPANCGMRPAEVPISRAAIEATRYVLHYYECTAVKHSLFKDEARERTEIAKLIDISLGLRHALRALPYLRRVEPAFRRGQMTELEIRCCLRDVGCYLEMMPNYEDRREQSKLLV